MYNSVELEDIKELQRATNADTMRCIHAIEYAMNRQGGYHLAVAYVKASMITVSNNTIGFDDTIQRIYRGGY